MATYTVHAPPDGGDAAETAVRMLVLKDGFSFWAFLLPPLWLAVHRLWLALAGWLVVAAALGAAGRFLGPAADFWLELLFALWFGLAAGDIRRAGLERRGWRLVGLVEGEDRESAELRFFAAWRPPARAAALTPAPPSPVVPAGRREVIGLFPSAR